MKKKWRPVVRDNVGSKYLALVEAIETGIAKKELSPGDKLPSNRELGELFGVTIATVTKAMSEATRRGLVEARVGSGTFILDRNLQEESLEEIDLAINTLPTAVVADILRKAMEQISTERLCHDLFDYSSYVCTPHHRRLAAAWIAQFGTEVSPDNLMLTNGVHQGLLAAFGVLLAGGETAVCEPLTYTGIKRIAEYRGVRLIGAECDEQGLTPEGIDKELGRSGAKVVLVTTTAQNPTTGTLTIERRQALVEVCRKHDAWIIEDGVNMPLANDGMPSIAGIAPERTIHLTGFSKCIASGFRLGYAAVPEKLLAPFHDALLSTQWTGPMFYAQLAAAMFDDGLIDQCIARHREEAAARTALASRILSGIRKADFPSYHAWVSVPAGWSAETFSAHASRAGIRVSPAAHFAVSSVPVPSCYRISLGACATRAELEAGLARLARIGAGPSVANETII